MGIYVFTTDYLVELLNARRCAGHLVVTTSARTSSRPLFGKVAWARICSPEANGAPSLLAGCGYARFLLEHAHGAAWMARPAMDLYDSRWPIHTAATVAPPARIADDGGRHRVSNSLLAAGVSIGRSSVNRSVLSTGSRVGDGCVLDEVVVLPGARIGAGCKLRRVIVDSNAEVPDGTVVGYSAPAARTVPRRCPALHCSPATRAEPKDFRSVA